MAHVNIDRLTDGLLIHTVHMCINRLWNVCKQIDYTHIHLHTASMHSCHTLPEPRDAPARWMMDGVRVRTYDTREHPFISVTQLIPLPSHPLRHSASRQTPPPNPHPAPCVSRLLFPLSVCLLSSLRFISFSSPSPYSPLFGSNLRKNGNLVYVFNFCYDIL